MKPKANTSYYVDDSSSAHFGSIVYFSDGAWRDHLTQKIADDFQGDLLVPKKELLLPRRKADTVTIETFLEEQECEGFFHFTDIKLLPSIFKSGYIASRSLVEEKEFPLIDSLGSIGANNRLVTAGTRVQDYARFTVQAANPIIYHWQGIHEGNDGKCIPQPCLITVTPSLATMEAVQFATNNANYSSGVFGNTLATLSQIPINDLQKKGSLMYHVSIRGAEVLHHVAAPINFLTTMTFRSLGEGKYAMNLTRQWPWWNKVEKELNHAKMGTRIGNTITFLDDVFLGVEVPEFDGEFREDQKRIPVTAKEVGFNFLLHNPQPNHEVYIRILHREKPDTFSKGFVEVGEGRGKAIKLNKWNLKDTVKQRGTYEVRLSLQKGDKSFRIYATQFEVA